MRHSIGQARRDGQFLLLIFVAREDLQPLDRLYIAKDSFVKWLENGIIVVKCFESHMGLLAACWLKMPGRKVP